MIDKDACFICGDPLRWDTFEQGALQEAVCCYMVYEKHPDGTVYAKVMSTKVSNGA